MSNRDIYQEVTDTVISALEQGTVPWRRPWRTLGDGLHRNLKSKRVYRGVNQFLLDITAHAHGYESPHWVTFKQAKEMGGKVRKGERATLVVFWKQLAISERDKESGKEQRKTIPLLRHFQVFNVDQCDGIDAPTSEGREFDPITEAAAIVVGMPNRPSIGHGGDRACYYPATDQVRLPAPDAFDSGEHYYSTAFHELVHSTGHPSRLNRPEIAQANGFGSDPYSREELVAEMGAAMLCGVAAISGPTMPQSAAYIAHWLKQLRDDRKLLVTAASRAQKAADHILGTTFEAA